MGYGSALLGELLKWVFFYAVYATALALVFRAFGKKRRTWPKELGYLVLLCLPIVWVMLSWEKKRENNLLDRREALHKELSHFEERCRLAEPSTILTRASSEGGTLAVLGPDRLDPAGFSANKATWDIMRAVINAPESRINGAIGFHNQYTFSRACEPPAPEGSCVSPEFGLDVLDPGRERATSIRTPVEKPAFQLIVESVRTNQEWHHPDVLSFTFKHKGTALSNVIVYQYRGFRDHHDAFRHRDFGPHREPEEFCPDPVAVVPRMIRDSILRLDATAPDAEPKGPAPERPLHAEGEMTDTTVSESNVSGR